MSPNAAAVSSAGWALFLDVDGTLLEIADTPGSVRVSEQLKYLLVRLSLRLDGALAIMSGRTLADLDELFAPLRLCASGVFGCERREGSGCVVRPALNPKALEDLRRELQEFVSRRPGLVLEDKQCALALHFRLAPDLSGEVQTLLRASSRKLGEQYRLQAGKCVLEVRPNGCTTGTAISEFMQQMPFRGRTPVFIGDDVSDEDGFSVVNSLGGLSIKVGDTGATLAEHHLPSVQYVLQWLEAFPPPSMARGRQ